MRRDKKICFLSMLLVVCLCGCGGGGASGRPHKPGEHPASQDAAKGGYQAPAFSDAVFHEDAAEGTEQMKVDVSSVSLGYVAVTGRSDKRIKFRVTKGEVTYTYDVENDGTPCIFPLQSGNGKYTFELLEQVVEKSYASVYSVDCDVTLQDEFQPFLRPSQYANYTAQSQCVKRASELAAAAPDELGVVSAIFDEICEKIAYDDAKALAVTDSTGYLPEPDETLSTKKGICFDYASLAAAMLRSQGIPVKIVFGYVSPDDLYHAWNMFYTTQTGWVCVGYDVSAGNWYRMDTTFSAGGADDQFVGDGKNYVDAKYY